MGVIATIKINSSALSTNLKRVKIGQRINNFEFDNHDYIVLGIRKNSCDLYRIGFKKSKEVILKSFLRVEFGENIYHITKRRSFGILDNNNNRYVTHNHGATILN